MLHKLFRWAYEHLSLSLHDDITDVG